MKPAPVDAYLLRRGQTGSSRPRRSNRSSPSSPTSTCRRRTPSAWTTKRVLAYSWLSTDIRTGSPADLPQLDRPALERAGAGRSAATAPPSCRPATRAGSSPPPRSRATSGEPDGTTGALKLDLMRSAALRIKASVSWLIRKTPRDQLRPARHLLAVRRPVLRPDRGVRRGRRPAVSACVVVMVPGQGHTLAAWLGTQEQVLPFLLNHQP